MAEVNDAIILAGGLGTRMLPASMYMPKETLPLFDTPILNHLIWEAAKTGVSRIHLVISKEKFIILEKFLANKDQFSEKVRDDLPREVLRFGAEGVEIVPKIQSSPGGVADAISVALPDIKGPFLVLLGDIIMHRNNASDRLLNPTEASTASTELVNRFHDQGLPCVGVCRVSDDDLNKYGVVELSGNKIVNIVEKPSVEEAPSKYVLCGRYLLPENTEDILELFPKSEFGELQSIYLLNYLIEKNGLNSVKLDDWRMYDSGDPLTWLKSQIDYALGRSDVSENLERWISERISDQGYRSYDSGGRWGI